MSDWREQLVGPATFRGVPFLVEGAERAGGRRTVRHEFPLRDKPFFEDMGRRARTFPVEGFVLGTDYLAQRDALIAALEEPGPGELIHPHYGTRRAIVTDFRVRESTTDEGIARFGITFEETDSEPESPTISPAAADRVDAAGDAIVNAFRVQIAARKTVSLPVSALENLSGVVTSAAAALGQALAPVTDGTQELAALQAAVVNLSLDAYALASEPADVLDGFLGAVESLTSVVNARLAVTALLAAYAFEPSATRPPETTPTRQAEQELYDLMLGLIRTVELIQATRLAASAEYDSYDAAVAVRDALAEALDEQAETASDDVYPTLADLRTELIRAVPGEDTDLPRLTRYTPASTVPSIVLAYRLYGDLDREQDLVARNSVVHPGFVLGGRELEVLSAS